MRRIRSALFALLTLGAAGARAGAEPPAPGAKPAAGADAALAKERAEDPLTTLERGVLKRCSLVVVARIHGLRDAVGSAPALVRVEVERRLYGTATGDDATSFTMFVGGPPSDTSPTRFYAPYFRPGAGGRHVLFLAPTPAGSGWALDSTFPLDDPDGDEKVRVLEVEIGLASVRDGSARRAKTLAHLLALLGADRPWSRLHAARELAALAAAAPEAFTPAALKEIAARRARTTDARSGALLGSVLTRFPDVVADPGAPGAPAPIGLLAPDPAPTPATAPRPAPPAAPPAPSVGIAPDPDEATGPAPAPATPPPPAVPAARLPDLAPLRARLAQAADPVERVQALSALAKAGGSAAAPDLIAAAGDADPAVREQAALLAGDVGATEVWPTLEAREATESSVAVREAIVRAAGLFRDPRLVSWIAKRADERALRRTASFALARIRTPAAGAELARRGREAEAAGDPAFARLAEYLQSDAFVRVERQAKREVGPR